MTNNTDLITIYSMYLASTTKLINLFASSDCLTSEDGNSINNVLTSIVMTTVHDIEELALLQDEDGDAIYTIPTLNAFIDSVYTINKYQENVVDTIIKGVKENAK